MPRSVCTSCSPATSPLAPPSEPAHPQTEKACFVPSRDLLQKRPSRYLIHGRGKGADLRLLRIHNTLWVVKDFAQRPWWLRWTLGLWFNRREFAALHRLQGTPGIPAGVTRVDRFAFAYHYVEGIPLDMMRVEELSPGFFRRYEELVEAIHRRGIVHLSLHRPDNIVITPDRQPVLLDFQSHVYLPRWFAWLTALLASIDFTATHKLWNRYMLAVLSNEAQPSRAARR